MISFQTDILPELLLAKENRSNIKIKNAEKGLNTLTLSLNIPGIPKSNNQIQAFFNRIVDELKNYLIAHNIKWYKDKELTFNDAAGDYFAIALKDNNPDIPRIKSLTELFEQNHILGRLIDIDLFQASKGHISSGKQKKCYFCQTYPAIDCMRQQRHTYQEMRLKIQQDILKYLQTIKTNQFKNKLISVAVKSILYEVSLSPKPGLVTYQNSGNHNDMHYFTFLDSSASLAPYFVKFSEIGLTFKGDLNQSLPLIRQIGLEAEQAMFQATHQVNTQKGIIFIFGISIFAYSYLFAQQQKLSVQNFRTTVMAIGKDLVEKELLQIDKLETHGQKVFKQYGIGGIRQEVATGFESIFNTAFAYLSTHLSTDAPQSQTDIQNILTKTLLLIMSENNDTNILYRSNLDILQKVQKLSKQAVNSQQEYEHLCQFCQKYHISPGGSADLLALSIFINEINTFSYEL